MSHSADSKVAKRYAVALFNTATKTGTRDAVRSDLVALADLWAQQPKLAQLMESPLVPAAKKSALVKEMFGSQISDLTTSFLNLLIEKRRVDMLPGVNDEFQRQVDSANRLLRADATVASPLTEADRAALISSLESRTGMKVDLTVAVDANILGGVIVRMQDTVIDGSVRGSLERLREQLLHER